MSVNKKFKIPPVFVAFTVQLISLSLVIGSLSLLSIPASPLLFVILCGVFAAILSYAYGMARWWLIIQLLLPGATLLMLKFNISPLFYLGAFLLMVLIYWSTFKSQVPLYLSSKRVWHTLEELLPPVQTGLNYTFADIGAGTGGVITHLAKLRPDISFTGIENAPLPFLISWLRIRLGMQQNCKIIWGDFWSSDFAAYDVVYAYLSPVPMSQLWSKATREMRPGTLLISNTFEIPDHPANYSITLDDLHHSTLYIWHMHGNTTHIVTSTNAAASP